MVDDDIDDIAYELRPNLWTRMHQARYRSLYNAHPDCRDPDHPKCEKCQPEGETNE